MPPDWIDGAFILTRQTGPLRDNNQKQAGLGWQFAVMCGK
jgi:hypothetical protein